MNSLNIRSEILQRSLNHWDNFLIDSTVMEFLKERDYKITKWITVKKPVKNPVWRQNVLKTLLTFWLTGCFSWLRNTTFLKKKKKNSSGNSTQLKFSCKFKQI